MTFDFNTYIKELEQLVMLESGSYNREGTKKVAHKLIDLFEGIGFRGEIVTVHEAVGPCVKLVNQKSEKYDILLVGHMDTVFKEGTVVERPFTIKNGRAYGPGVYDMKASLLSAYYAFAALQSQDALKNCSICLAFNSDEELSSKYSRTWLESLAQNARYGLVLEPARADGSMVHKRRGVGRYKIDIQGVASHSGLAPEKGVSAINELAYWIIGLHKITDYTKETNVNVGVVEGGNTVNTVAPHASAQVDLRISEMSEVQRFEESIKHMLANPQTPGVKVQVTGGITRPPMNPCPRSLALAEAVTNIAKSLKIDFEWKATGGGSDANILAAMGVATLDGFGPVGGLSHTTDEYLELNSIEPRMKLLKETILYIANRSSN